MPRVLLTISFSGEQKSLSVGEADTVSQILKKFREEYSISRFTWLELRANGRLLRGSLGLAQSHLILAPTYEIIDRNELSCF